MIIHKKQYKVKEILCRKFRETTGIEIQSQHWGGNRQLSTEGIAVEYFTISLHPVRNEEKSEFN